MVVRAFFFAAAVATVSAQAPVSFNKDIRPIMSDTCFRCHGPDKSSRMANMRLDLRDEATKPNRRGLTPIVPGKPEESEIVRRIFSDGPQIMPPAAAHKTLTAAQKDTIRRWVLEGAKYEGHWAYEPVRRPAVPPGTTNAIDFFIAQRLTQAGLKPAPEADKRTLIRRVSLDLTGIPPTPQEADAFTNDSSNDAYEKLVDRLMASPRYAEKQSMHWLDAVRYADTAGYHGDNPFPAWPYRDYVLRAIRDNMPFDRFTREQLAGDLLPDATREQKVASAYNRILRVSAEGGLQPKEYLAKYGADRVRTTATTFLGATIGCAECHDHKFDPFLARDFYAMKAFFADIKETGLVPDRGPKAWGSLLELATPEHLAERKSLQKDVDAAYSELSKLRANNLTRKLLKRDTTKELAWVYQRPVSASAKKATLRVYNDELIASNPDGGGTVQDRTPKPGNGLIVASGDNPDNETYTIELKPGAGEWLQLGLQAMTDESLPGLRVARGADRLMISEVEAELLPDGKKLRFQAAMSSIRIQSPDQNPLNAFDGNPATGWGVSTNGDTPYPFLALRFNEPVKTTADSRIRLRVSHDTIYRKATVGRLRVALSAGMAVPVIGTPERKMQAVSAGLPEAVKKTLAKPEKKRSKDEREQLESILDWTNAASQTALVRWLQAKARYDAAEQTIPRVMVTETVEKPDPTRVLARGNFLDESGAIVEPAIPVFLGKLDTTGRATRLDLANWIVSKENPLTARAYVNRQWRLFFGTGLSRVLEDLGSQGEWPTHPELLDWLASEFMDSGWDMKRLNKTIVMSHTYRQSSEGETPSDPDNRLLARQNRLRVDAEIVRDVALSVSGLLHEEFGGPSVRPVQPDGYLGALNFPKRDYSASRGENLYRRGLYTFWQRTFLHPSLVAFDAASREECTLNRTTSNTPLQALVLLNDPEYVEAARVFAQNAMRGASDLNGRLDWAFRRAVSRNPNAEERRILTDLYRSSLRRFDSDPKAAQEFVAAGEAPDPATANSAEFAATMTVTRAILNLHETITRN